MLDARGEDYKGAVDQLGQSDRTLQAQAGMEDRPYLEGYLQARPAYIELGKAATKDSPEQEAAYQASYDEVQN